MVKKMTKYETLWDYFLFLYQKNFGIRADVVEKYAVLDILERVASGQTNQMVADTIAAEVEYVDDVVKKYFSFPGWERELDVDMWQMYRTLGGDTSYTRSVVFTISSIMDNKLFLQAYKNCRELEKIQKEVNSNVR